MKEITYVRQIEMKKWWPLTAILKNKKNWVIEYVHVEKTIYVNFFEMDETMAVNNHPYWNQIMKVSVYMWKKSYMLKKLKWKNTS